MTFGAKITLKMKIIDCVHGSYIYAKESFNYCSSSCVYNKGSKIISEVVYTCIL